MGGTSTDCTRYDGILTHTLETVISGITIQSPQLEINTVAAGGGSILTYRNGLFNAGPQSAGAHPGPCCYRKGGPLCVTDANLILGRLSPDHFPKIFGPNEDASLDYAASRAAFDKLTEEINADLKKSGGKTLSVEEVALGFVNVANESMCRPIRQLTESKGFTSADHNLASFGGAGGQHACVSNLYFSFLKYEPLLIIMVLGYCRASQDQTCSHSQACLDSERLRNGSCRYRARRAFPILWYLCLISQGYYSTT